MDQIGLALSRRKLPRKPFSRRICLAGCALEFPSLPLVLSAYGPPSLLLSAPPSPLSPPPRALLFCCSVISSRPPWGLPSHSKGNLTGVGAVGYIAETILSRNCHNSNRSPSNLNRQCFSTLFFEVSVRRNVCENIETLKVCEHRAIVLISISLEMIILNRQSLRNH